MQAFELRHWVAALPQAAPIDYPPLVWTASPDVLRGARLGGDGAHLVTGDGEIAMRPVAKITQSLLVRRILRRILPAAPAVGAWHAGRRCRCRTHILAGLCAGPNTTARIAGGPDAGRAIAR